MDFDFDFDSIWFRLDFDLISIRFEFGLIWLDFYFYFEFDLICATSRQVDFEVPVSPGESRGLRGPPRALLGRGLVVKDSGGWRSRAPGGAATKVREHGSFPRREQRQGLG